MSNLYGFAEPQTIKLSDITHVVGPNNSGKTNIARILKLIERSLRLDPLRLNERHLRCTTDSALQIELEFTKEEVDLMAGLLAFPRNEEDKKLDVSLVSEKLAPLMNEAKITINWKYDGTDNTIPYVIISFIKLGIDFVLYDRDRIIEYHSSDDIYRTRQTKDQTFVQVLAKLAEMDSTNIKAAFEAIFSENGSQQGGSFAIKEAGIPNRNTYATHGHHFVTFVKKLRMIMNLSLDNDHQITLEGLVMSIFKQKFVFTDELRGLKRAENLGSAEEVLKPDGSNLANYLFRLATNRDNKRQELYNLISSEFGEIFGQYGISLRAILDTFVENRDRSHLAPVIYVFDKRLNNQLPLENMGSGIFEAAYLLGVSTSITDGLIVLDEPALHLHPIQINALKRLIIKNTISSNTQLISITHSPAFLGRDVLEDGVEMIYVNRQEGESRLFQASEEDKRWIKQNKEALRYDLNPIVFFARCVILVEGDSEVGFMEGFVARRRRNLEQGDIQLFPVGGKLNFKRIAKLLRIFSIGFVLLADRDALVEHSSEKLSAILSTAWEVDPIETKKLTTTITEIDVEEISVDPKWIRILKNALTLDEAGSAQISAMIQRLSAEYSISSRRFRDHLYQKLSEFAERQNMYVVSEGEIEDLLEKTDPNLFMNLRKVYGQRSRLLARAFVSQVQEEKLDGLVVGDKVLNAAMK